MSNHIEMTWPEDNTVDEYYFILCSVSGGVTGSRSSILKAHGEPVVYESYDEAKAAADELNERMNGPNARAHFSYRVIGG